MDQGFGSKCINVKCTQMNIACFSSYIKRCPVGVQMAGCLPTKNLSRLVLILVVVDSVDYFLRHRQVSAF